MSWSIDNRGTLGGQLGWFSKKNAPLYVCIVVVWGALGSGCGASHSNVMIAQNPTQARSVVLSETERKEKREARLADRRWEVLWASPNKVASTSHLVIRHVASKEAYGKGSDGFRSGTPRKDVSKVIHDPSPPPTPSIGLDVLALRSGVRREEKTISAALAAADYGLSTYRVAMHQRSADSPKQSQNDLDEKVSAAKSRQEKMNSFSAKKNQEKKQKQKKRPSRDLAKKAHSNAKDSGLDHRTVGVGRQIGCVSRAHIQNTRRLPDVPKKPCLPKLLPFSYAKQDADITDIPVALSFAKREATQAQTPQGVPQHTGLDWSPSTSSHIGMPRDPRFRWVKRLYGSRFWGFTWVMLKRRSLFEHRMRPLLRKEGVPEELFLLTGVESNYSVRLLSRAYAVGIWQIIQKTGLRYGLRITEWIDERRHIEKATVAAARYLRDLYQRYGQWEWALAAYNCGEWCVDRAINRCPRISYWQARLRRGCGLPQETKDYVARYYSILYYYRNYPASRRPVWTVEPLRLVAVKTPGPVRLREVAEAIGLEVGDLFYYNSELSSWATPPGEKYPLLVPPDYAQKLRDYFAGHQQEVQPWRWKTVRVGTEKSVKYIAKKYDVTSDTVSILNRIRGNTIPEERKFLLLPVWKSKGMKRKKKWAALGKLTTQVRRFRWNHPALRLERKLIPCYRVRKGDSWRRLSRRHGVSEKLLMHYNGLRPLRKGSWIRLRQWARCHHLQKRKPPTKTGNVALLTSEAND